MKGRGRALPKGLGSYRDGPGLRNGCLTPKLGGVDRGDSLGLRGSYLRGLGQFGLVPKHTVLRSLKLRLCRPSWHLAVFFRVDLADL